MAETCIVIGAGMVGAACAFRLQQSGLSVTLVDPGVEQLGASFGNAGHIAVEQVEPLASLATLRKAPTMLFVLGGPLDFRLGDIAAWGPWAARFVSASGRRRFEAGTLALSSLMVRGVDAWTTLLDDAGARDLIQTDGHALLWFSDDEARKGRQTWRATNTGAVTTRELGRPELARYQAILPDRPPVAGLHFDGAARLASPALVRRALIAAFEQAGGRLLVGEAQAVTAQGEVRVSGERIQADRMLVSAGVHSRGLMEQLGATTPLMAERGYSIQFDVPAWDASLPTAVVEGQSIVLAPHSEGLRATSYVEFARPGSPPDPAKWERLESRVRAMGLPVPANPQRWMGCRPTLPDYLPAIGRLNEKVYYAFGHQHLGVTLSAVTAERIAAIMGGGEPDPRFDIRRFRH